MFRHQGPGRSERQNRVLAGTLAFVGGFVNSAGFVLIGAFTSHVTGNVGRLANDLAMHQTAAAVTSFVMITAFFVGAFVASMCVESNLFGPAANAYGVALLGESVVLALFMLASARTGTARGAGIEIETGALCFAMGIQNSLVTRLSGAVVRTTHLTGVVTDLGIEAARWFRWWRGTISGAIRVRLAFGRNPPERPNQATFVLLATIACSFALGAVCGGTATLHVAHVAMLLPVLALAAGAVYAFVTGRRETARTRAGAGRDSRA